MTNVYFIGAGPGDPDLITVKGSATMTLDEVIEVMLAGVSEGKMIARVHTGDPAIYGAHREQMDELDKHGISYQVVPGVSSFLASAAVINKEFTLPTVSQTVICTRIAGRTAVPEGEALADLASHRASMAIFLSVQRIGEVVKELSQHYPLTTPVVVVQRATWPDQKIVYGTLETIEEAVKDAKITKTAQILVGDFLGDRYEKSQLYNAKFSHGYRRGAKVESNK